MRRLTLFLLAIALVGCSARPTPITPTSTITPPTVEPQETIYPEAEALPGGVLLVYNREGGFAYSNTTLILHTNGAVEVTVLDRPSITPTPFQVTISATDLAAIQAILNDPAFAAQPFGPGSACADCYIYTLTARTSNGIISVKADDAELSNGNLGLYQTLINRLQAYAK